MVKVFENDKGTLVVRTKGLKQAKSPAIREAEERKVAEKESSGKKKKAAKKY